MMALERAIQRAFDRLNLEDGASCDIYRIIYQYKAISDLPDEEIDKIYDDLAARLGFTN